MPDPIRQELAEVLHALSLGDSVACDYHARPKTIESDETMVIEAIRIVDHPQLEECGEGWQIDAVRCDDHTVAEIDHSTRGFEEALLRVPITESNNVVSVDAPAPDAVEVLAFEPATEGLYPLVLDQQLLAASEPGDVGLSRWMRVQGIVAADPPDELREHVERLIERSPEVPASFE